MTEANNSVEKQLYRPTGAGHAPGLYLRRASAKKRAKLLEEFARWRRTKEYPVSMSATDAALVCRLGRDHSQILFWSCVRVVDDYSGTKTEHKHLVLLPADYRLRAVKSPPSWQRAKGAA